MGVRPSQSLATGVNSNLEQYVHRQSGYVRAGADHSYDQQSVRRSIAALQHSLKAI